ncbi:hypothetical protein [Aneurinibacillus uraniidurans]|uniref:hypothetical protein n=1 Tax=Aneurinibacillus uraniidurans TaxID=2966586 RepID=UPI002349C456|nr:hypothetical protein [Aneurinibacillus sp. B1]WCN38139.1 hypothetical protein PO771_01545 [Aneurinibacillus sp. B1]
MQEQQINKIEVLETAQEYMVKLCQGIETAGEYLMAGNEGEALNYVVQIIEGLQWLLEVIVLTQDAQKESIDITEMLAYFHEAREALENQDYILLSDLLSYEVAPILEGWQQKNAMNL